jgi:hypothetical protein
VEVVEEELTVAAAARWVPVAREARETSGGRGAVLELEEGDNGGHGVGVAAAATARVPRLLRKSHKVTAAAKVTATSSAGAVVGAADVVGLGFRV